LLLSQALQVPLPKQYLKEQKYLMASQYLPMYSGLWYAPAVAPRKTCMMILVVVAHTAAMTQIAFLFKEFYMIFKTQIDGIFCYCQVTHYLSGTLAKTIGAWEDAEEATDEEFEFDILDVNKNVAPWLKEKMTDEDENRIREEFHVTVLEEKHCYHEIHGIH
jgi:hypothetical protein